MPALISSRTGRFSAAAALAAVILGMFLVRPLPAAAAAFNYDNLTEVILSGPGITLNILPGSQATHVAISTSSLTITLSDGEIFMVRYPGPAPGMLYNNGGLPACQLVGGNNEVALAGPTAAPVVFTPTQEECTPAASVGGGAAVVLLQPNGGESWGPGAPQGIFWSSSGGGIMNIRLKLSVDGGADYPTVIAGGTINDSAYDWMPPDWGTQRAMIMIEAIDVNGSVMASDVSDACFALTGSVSKDSGRCTEPAQPGQGNNGSPPENPPVTPPAQPEAPQLPAPPAPPAQPEAPQLPAPPAQTEVPQLPPSSGTETPQLPPSSGTETPSLPPPAVDPSNSGSYEPSVAVASTPTIDVDKGYSWSAAPANCQAGSLIKMPDDGDSRTTADRAVYYCGADGKRHAFPNERVFFSWFKDFSGVTVVSPAAMAAIPLGANVTYRPGKKMVKVSTDPKVYTVSRGGLLRWVMTEVVAAALYGSGWNKMIDDVPDSFFVDYKIGDPISAS